MTYKFPATTFTNHLTLEKMPLVFSISNSRLRRPVAAGTAKASGLPGRTRPLLLHEVLPVEGSFSRICSNSTPEESGNNVTFYLTH